MKKIIIYYYDCALINYFKFYLIFFFCLRHPNANFINLFEVSKFLMTRIVVARFTSCEPVNVNLETPGKRWERPGSISRVELPVTERSLLPHHAVRWLLAYKYSSMTSWTIKYLNLNSLDLLKKPRNFPCYQKSVEEWNHWHHKVYYREQICLMDMGWITCSQKRHPNSKIECENWCEMFHLQSASTNIIQSSCPIIRNLPPENWCLKSQKSLSI